MILTCPECKNSLDVDERIPNEMIETVCKNCHSLLRVKRIVEVDLIKKPDIRPKPSAVETEEVPSIDLKKVLVAIEGSATREVTKEVLNDAGFEVIETSTGREALFLLKKFRPAIAVLDVGLPQIFGFEVCEVIKKSQVLKDTSVILVASIYDKARYKREPESLYGADDYIERHHIRDELYFKIKRLLGVKSRGHGETVVEDKKEITEKQRAPLGPKTVSAVEPRKVSAEKKRVEDIDILKDLDITATAVHEVRQDKPLKPQKGFAPSVQMFGDPEEHDAAKRLARIILSDIALYNQKAVNEGVRNNTFHQILKDDLEEGRRLFNSRISKEIREAKDYFREAVEEFIEKRKSLL